MIKIVGAICFGLLALLVVWPLLVPFFLLAYWLTGVKRDLDKIPDRYRK